MLSALIVYHKKVHGIYPDEWLKQFTDSIQAQTCQEFDIIELNYGAGVERLFPNSKFISKEFPTFVDGMNYLLGECFTTLGYQYVFNTNVDDYYAPERIERQLAYLKGGYDIVSSNFALIDTDGREFKRHAFHKSSILREFRRNHNIIAHPVVAYSKKSFSKGLHYNPSEIPYEDLELWKRMLPRNKFVILQDCLLFHRVHENSVCQNTNNR